MKKYIALALLGIFIGCTFNKNKSTEDHVLCDLNKKYDNVNDFFGNKMVSHFPKKIDKHNVTFTESLSPELGNLELILINKVERDHLADIVEEFEKKSIAIYNANDSCLLIVNRFVNKDKYFEVTPSKEDLQLVNRDCYSGLFPIPNFWHNDFTTEETLCRLPSDFRLYVVDSKSGENIDEKYLTDGRFMPKEWKNGYSKGVAISEKQNVIIYWLIIW